MLGVDYSEASVHFARRIGEVRRDDVGEDNNIDDGSEGEVPVEFVQHDILVTPSPTSPLKSAGPWDVVLDKGTFDAISLSAERDAAGRPFNEGYRARVLELVREDGMFLITSCNWTEAELEAWFASSNGGEDRVAAFEVADRIRYRSFSFGGVKGQTISSLCFRKVGLAGGGDVVS